VGNLFVGCFIRSEKMFSQLLTQHDYGPELNDDGTEKEHTRHVIQLNEVGVLFLHNLVCCLLGDHRDPALYLDSAFSSTLAMIEPIGHLPLFQMATRLEREHPELYARIHQVYNAWQGPERFAESADSVRKLFYQYVGTNTTDLHAITIKLVLRFILGHEIGHYVRKNNPRIRAQVENFVERFKPGIIQNDSELFSDIRPPAA
jgi:hypothetical protein